MPPTSNLSKELGVDSPITKNREGVDLPLAYTSLLSYDNKSKKANCISVTKMAFDLQNMLFEYKSGFSITKILFYKKIINCLFGLTYRDLMYIIGDIKAEVLCDGY